MNSNQLPENEYSSFNATYIKALDNVHLIENLIIGMPKANGQSKK